jgi:hypothetical protein
METYMLPGVMLMKSEMIKLAHYDTNYKVNGWKEETDFQLALNNKKKKLVFCPFVLAYHLPKLDKKQGGNRSANRLKYEYWVIINNLRFAKKNRQFLRSLKIYQPFFAALYWTVYRWGKLVESRLYKL